MTEHRIRIATKVTAWSSWLGALAATGYIVRLPMTHEHRQYSIVIVLLIGIGIASGLALSRHKMSDTIVGALKAGYDLSEEKARRRVNAAEVMASERHDEAMKQAREEIEKQETERERVHARDDEEDKA